MTEIGGQMQLYRKIRDGKELDKYQLLCANCNTIKKIENGELAKTARIFAGGGE